MRTSAVRSRALAVAGGAVAITFLSATGAAAHVSVTPSTTDAGDYAVATFAVPHGCGDSPTTQVAITIPDAIAAVTPTVNPGWEVSTVAAEPPTDGAETSSGQVIYTATTPLPPDLRDTFELSFLLPENIAGEVLVFPTIQTCEQGEVAWVQVPAAGQDEHDLDSPAPSFTVTEPSVHGHDEEEAVDLVASESASESGSGAALGVAVAALIVAVLGVITASVAVVRTRRP